MRSASLLVALRERARCPSGSSPRTSACGAPSARRRAGARGPRGSPCRASRRPRRARPPRAARARARRARGDRTAGPACRPRCGRRCGSAWRSRRGSMPPTQVVMRAPVSAYSHASSRWTCSASSRVGVTISARGAPGGPNALGLAEQRAARARGRTRRSCPSRSAPRRGGRDRAASRRSTAAWTGVGSTYSRRVSAARRLGCADGKGMA